MTDDPLRTEPETDAATTDRRDLVLFFSTTFALSWLLWFAASILTQGAPISAGWRALFFLPGIFGPAIVAVGLTARATGTGGLSRLLTRAVAWRVGPQWFVFALSYMAGVKLTAAAAYRLTTGAWPPFGTTPWLLLLIGAAMSTPVQVGEELGWRGFALPRLARLVGFAPASLLLGGLWALWHLPLFFLPATGTTSQPFLPYLLSVTAISVAMTWLYVQTSGSLLLMMVMHAAVNNTRNIVPSGAVEGESPFSLGASMMSWLTVAVLWAAVVGFLPPLWREGRRSRSGAA